MMNVELSWGDEGRAYFVRSHVPFDQFMQAVRLEVVEGDLILNQKPVHCSMRVCRDFQQEISVFIDAKEGSRGSFKCTWIQDT